MVYKNKIEGVVVLYHPDAVIIDNIGTYINELECLYVIDNSETYTDSIVEQLRYLSNVKYINNGGNKGIANALNAGAKLASAAGAAWLLTMDQDSKFEPGEF